MGASQGNEPESTPVPREAPLAAWARCSGASSSELGSWGIRAQSRETGEPEQGANTRGLWILGSVPLRTTETDALSFGYRF